MSFPETTPMRLVVLPNKGGYGFDIDKQKLKLFEPDLNSEQAGEFIKQCTKTIYQEYSRKKKEEVHNRHKWSYRFLKVALILILSGFAIFQYPIYVEIEESANLIYAGFAVLFLALIITVGVIIKTLCMRRRKIDMNTHI